MLQIRIDHVAEFLHLDRFGRLPRKQIQRHGPDGVDIALRHRMSHELLGRHIAIRSGNGRSTVFDLRIGDGTKVDEPDFEFAEFVDEHDIARLNIAVNNRLRAIVQRI